jgi:hypothetical protein
VSQQVVRERGGCLVQTSALSVLLAKQCEQIQMEAQHQQQE